MQALILAGGLGTRLRPLTDTSPKSMISVLGKPFLEYELEMLRHYDITDIVLSTGYLGGQIEKYFGDGKKMGLNIRYSCEENPIGTAGGIKLASRILKDRFFVIYGDSYLPIDYRKLQVFFESSKKIGLLVTYDNKCGDTTVPCNIAVDDEGTVIKYKKNSKDSDLYLVEAGVLAFRKAVLSLIPEDRVISLEQDIFPRLIEQKELISYMVSQIFYDIGLPDRLKKFEEYVQNDYIENTF